MFFFFFFRRSLCWSFWWSAHRYQYKNAREGYLHPLKCYELFPLVVDGTIHPVGAVGIVPRRNEKCHEYEVVTHEIFS